MMKNNMEPVEHTEHTKFTRFMLFILAVVLLVASIIGYIASQKINNNGGPNSSRVVSPTPYALQPTPSLIPYPVKGSLVIKLSSGQPIQVGTPFTLDIYGTSSKDTVAGYDVVLLYDREVFENQSIQNKLNTFRIFTYKRPSHLAITATKNLSAAEPIRFTDTPILSLTFTAKKKGSYVFTLKPVGNESSKFVNETAAVTYPETDDIRLEIN